MYLGTEYLNYTLSEAKYKSLFRLPSLSFTRMMLIKASRQIIFVDNFPWRREVRRYCVEKDVPGSNPRSSKWNGSFLLSVAETFQFRFQ